MNGNLFLVDTSVWLEVLPAKRGMAALRERIDALLAADAVATTGMIRLELLGSARTEQEWQRLSELLSALRPLPITEDHWDEAAKMGFHLRRQGVWVPFTDLLIAAVAVKGDLVLLHRDRHFDRIASQLPVKVESHLTV